MTVGADPEFFLFDARESSYRIISAIDKGIEGTKEKPFDLGGGYNVHLDNVTIELGIPPQESGEHLGSVVHAGKELIREQFLAKFRDHRLHCAESQQFTEKTLESDAARQFGCEGDLDAYSGGAAPRIVPKSLREGLMRYAGGHMHIGLSPNCPAFVVAMYCDIFLAVWAQATWGVHPRPISPRKDKFFNPMNRCEWYGQPGIYREKEYGIEYRTLNNTWCSSPKRGNQMGIQVDKLIYFLQNTTATTLRDTLRNINWLEVRNVIAQPDNRQSATSRSRQAKAVLHDCVSAGVPA